MARGMSRLVSRLMGMRADEPHSQGSDIKIMTPIVAVSMYAGRARVREGEQIMREVKRKEG